MYDPTTPNRDARPGGYDVRPREYRDYSNAGLSWIWWIIAGGILVLLVAAVGIFGGAPDTGSSPARTPVTAPDTAPATMPSAGGAPSAVDTGPAAAAPDSVPAGN